MRRTSRLRTEVVCSHHNSVLVFDCENTGSRNNGLPAQIIVQPGDNWGVQLDGLGALDSLGEGVLNVVGSLMNRIGSVGIEGIVSLQML